jgi:PhoPQ-activated pathogenicity-related protein
MSAHLRPPTSRLAALLIFFTWACGQVLCTGCSGPPPPTPLDEYVGRPDERFSFKLLTTAEGAGYKAYILQMDSQTWRGGDEVDRPLWQHHLTLIVPSGAQASTAFLYIEGGDNDDGPPTRADGDLAQLATLTGTVLVSLRQVPNQPLRFAGDPTGRLEDDLIAYSWSRMMATGDPTWNARFPMVKSAVRAMDVAQSFLRDQVGLRIEDFVVGGGSKRGWTTWLTGAVDRRVRAIVPLVIDVLNLEPSFRHHVAAYGFWARATADYVNHGIMSRLGTAQMESLLAIEDPYRYRDRLALPKYIVNATGDQFFLPDSSRFYFDDLVGEKYLRYVPNAEHSLSGTDAAQGVVAFYTAMVTGRPLPRFTFSQEGEDALVLRSEDAPLQVNLWQARNDKARDFRVDTIGKTWTRSPLVDQGGGVYRAQVQRPAQGYAAFFIEMIYPSGEAFPFKFTTQVRVVPDTLPFAGLDPRTAEGEKPRGR